MRKRWPRSPAQYAGYSKLYDGGQVLEAACWGHVRRKFVDLHELRKSAVAAQMVDRIGALYAIEKTIRGHLPNERRAVRQEHSRPQLDAMKPWMAADARNAFAEMRDRQSDQLCPRTLGSSGTFLRRRSH